MEETFFSVPRIPDRRGNIPLGAGLLIPEIVNRHHATVRALHAAGITQVASAAIVTQDDRLTPALSCITADACKHSIGLRADSVSQTETTVGQTQKVRRISLAGIGNGPIDERPRSAIVGRSPRFDPASRLLVVLQSPERGEQFLR